MSNFSERNLIKTTAALDHDDLGLLLSDWQLVARDDQLPPEATAAGEAWRVWLILGGRGAGKTRAGAEWIRGQVFGWWGGGPARRIALVGETVNDVRNVMVEGESGLMAIHEASERPKFEPSKQRLTWPNGAMAEMYSAENAEGLRGPQFDAAWCDEIAKWREPETAWDMLQFGLRLGTSPQVVVTTTPRPVPIVKALLADPTVVVSRASTVENAVNLAPSYVADMKRRYAGTVLGRQELDGELIDGGVGSLWRRDWIDEARAETVGALRRIVVAVDPPVTSKVTSDACGIVVAAVGEDGRAYVLADRTVQGRTPTVWARAAVAAYNDYHADRIVAEVNQGGDLVITVLRQIDPMIAVRTVHASRGKWVRAEPIAALYAQGRVVHVGMFEKLEDQLCAFGTDGKSQGKSPDRLDALVWALTDLMIDQHAEPMIRKL